MKRLDEMGVSPAPWQASCSDGGTLAWVDSLATPDGVADMCAKGRERCKADARLCAAAPNMYEALAAMLSCAEKNAPYLDMSHMDIAMDMARKAIRKAGGE